MDIPVEHLKTFAAIVEEGSFEGAALRLHVTASAISQRVKAMERRVGSVLMQRTRPIEVTEAGETVLRLARQLDRLVDDAARELGGGGTGGAVIPVVVNADTLATWFVPTIVRASREIDARFEVIRADETLSTDRLRRGEAMAAITATKDPIPGCTSTRIGTDRYYAVASPDFIAEYFPTGLSAESLRHAPMLEFDRHDAFQHRFMRKITRTRIDPPTHFVPSSAEFALAISLGLGWGMLPELQCEAGFADGSIVALNHDASGDNAHHEKGVGSANPPDPRLAIKLPLYWQRWDLHSPVLDQLTAIVVDEASKALDPPLAGAGATDRTPLAVSLRR